MTYFIARADRPTSAGQFVWVTINGISRRAIAANEINSTEVLIADGNDGQLYAWSQTSPQTVSRRQQYFNFNPQSQAEELIVLPFQVIYKQDNSLMLGGDRDPIQIYEHNFYLAGITNLGQKQYQFAGQKDSTHIFWSFPQLEQIEINPYEYVRFCGGGAVLSSLIPQIPYVQHSITTSNNGNHREETATAPGYSFNSVYDSLNTGSYNATQTYTGSSGSIKWRYPYRELPLPACNYNDTNTTTPGNIYSGSLNSSSGNITTTNVVETLIENVTHRLNNLNFTGNKNYQGNSTYENNTPSASLSLNTNLTCTRFAASANFVGNSNLNFAGKTQTINNSTTEETTINYFYPISFSQIANNQENIDRTSSENQTIVFAPYSENRPQSEVYGGVYYNPNTQELEGATYNYNNDFYSSVTGNRIQHSSSNYSTTEYNLKLISSDRSASLITKRVINSITGENRTSHTNYSWNILSGTGYSNWIVDNQSYPNNSTGTFKFYILDSDGTETEIDLSDSFLYWIYQPTFTPPSTLPATITLSQQANNLYVRQAPILNNFVGRDIYLLIPNQRYLGTVVSYQYQQGQMQSVTINLTEVEDYLTTEVQHDDPAIYFYPQDNCARLLLDHVLGNPQYANFVRGNETVYCAKLWTPQQD